MSVLFLFCYFRLKCLCKVYRTLATVRRGIHKEARLIVEQQYDLLNIDSEHQGAYERKELTRAGSIALKVKRLLNNSDPTSIMPFAHGQPDGNVS
jgi:hypothetical protein